jgi:hypothetical protein
VLWKEQGFLLIQMGNPSLISAGQAVKAIADDGLPVGLGFYAQRPTYAVLRICGVLGEYPHSVMRQDAGATSGRSHLALGSGTCVASPPVLRTADQRLTRRRLNGAATDGKSPRSSLPPGPTMSRVMSTGLPTSPW